MSVFLILISSFIVRSVKIDSLKCGDPAFYKSFINFKQGKSVSIPDIDRVIRKLVKSNYASQAKVQVSRDSGNFVDITLNIRENPRIDTIIFKGNKKISRKVLADTISIKPGLPYSEEQAFETARFIEHMYARKGYNQAEVSPSFKFISSCQGILTLNVKEHKKNVIKSIEIVGAFKFNAHKILKKLKNKPKGFLRSGKFDEEKFNTDIKTVTDFYHNRGFPEATVDSYNIKHQGKYIYIKIYVTEGKKYYFGTYSFEGNKLFDRKTLDGMVIFRPGRAFSSEKLKKTVQNIASAYGDSGYIYLNVLPDEEIANDSTINLNFKITENNRIRIREIGIKGNTKTYDNVIRRELTLFPGDYFSRKQAIKSQRNLYYLNYFKNLSLDFRPVAEDSSLIDLSIKVEEKPTGTFGVGATYSQLDGLSAYLQMQEPNFLGRGEIAGGMIEYGGKRRNFSLNFTEPWIGGRRRSVGFSLYHTIHYLPDYNERKTGGSVNYSEAIFNDYTKIGFGYTIEKNYVYDISAPYQDLPYYEEWISKGPVLTSTGSINFQRDTRDRSFNAMKGAKTLVTMEIAGGPFLGDVDFIKTEFEQAKLFNYRGKLISALRIKAGLLNGLKQNNDVPFYERFFLGDIGPYGLRGYELRSVGPYENGVNIGGRFYNIFTFEERYRVNENMYGLIFFDAGNSFLNTYKSRPFVLKKGAGIGIRMQMPMLGIIGFDMAYGFENGHGKWVPHIQMGTSF